MMLRLTLLMLFFSAHAYAETLPRLTRHSETVVSANIGDRIVLQAEVKDQSQLFWYNAQQQICKGPSCTIDTSTLTAGSHLHILIAVNQLGSRSVEFRLQLAEKKDATSSRIIQVPWVNYVASDASLNKADPYVLSARHAGFSYRTDTPHRAQAKLDIILNTPRRLDWNETLRSAKSILKFGILESDEHFLWPKSKVQLFKPAGQNRVIVLEHGTLRSRRITSQHAAAISVIASNWLQIDGLAHADFVVELVEPNFKEAVIHVLRGEVQIRMRSPFARLDVFNELSEEERREEQRLLAAQEKQILLATAGEMIKLYEDHFDRTEIKPLSPEKTQTFLEQSTPFYWNLHTKSDTAEPSKPYGTPARLTTSDKAELHLKAAQGSLAENDYLLTLDHLLAAQAMAGSFLWEQLAGRAYAGLSLSQRAREHLQKAIKLQPDDSQSLFYLGKISAEAQNWAESIKYLSQALEQGAEFKDLIHYYLAVSYFHQQSWRQSKRQFLIVERQTRNTKLLQSSRQYLLVLADKQGFLADAEIGLLYDSHILGIQNDLLLQAHDPALSSQSVGYEASASFKKRFASQRSIDWSIAGDISRRAWFKPSLKEAAQVHQRLELGLRAGQQKALGLNLHVETFVVGSNRALDGVGAAFNVLLSRQPGNPTLRIGMTRYQDPLPLHPDLIDPLAERWQAVASDRSSQVSYLQFLLQPNPSEIWAYSMEVKAWQRILLNELAKPLSERRLDASLAVKWRLIRGFALLTSIQARHRDYFMAAVARKDWHIQTQLGSEALIAEHWLWKSSFLVQKQNSPLEEYSFRRVVAQSGLVYRF